MSQDDILRSIVRIHNYSTSARKLSAKKVTEKILVQHTALNLPLVGAGFLVWDERRVIFTCAHVIEDTLGHEHVRNHIAPSEPVYVTFPLCDPSQYKTAHVKCWWEPIDDPNHRGLEDIAFLLLDESAPPETEPARMSLGDLNCDHPLSVYGFPPGDDTGTWAHGKDQGPRLDKTRQMVMDPNSPGQAVAPGYSGAPVIDRKSDNVVGMMVTARTDQMLSWYIPTEMLLCDCETQTLLEALIKDSKQRRTIVTRAHLFKALLSHLCPHFPNDVQTTLKPVLLKIIRLLEDPAFKRDPPFKSSGFRATITRAKADALNRGLVSPTDLLLHLLEEPGHNVERVLTASRVSKKDIIDVLTR